MKEFTLIKNLFTKSALTLLTLLTMGIGNAWGYYSAKMNVYSSPSTGGYVYVGNSSNCSASSCGTKTSDNASSGNKGKIYNLSGNITFYLCNNPKDANYVFKGWSTSSTDNSGSGVNNNPYSQSVNGTSLNPTFNYYAIFARLTADKSSLSFGNKNSQSGWGNAQSVSVTYVHAGNVTATITGDHEKDFSFSNSASSLSTTVVSNNTNSETTTTITVYFNPQCNGSRSATLTISSNNGLTNQIVSLSGTGVLNPQSLSWENESDIELSMLKDTEQQISATATSGLAVTYSSSNTSVLYVNQNTGKLEARGLGTATITASQEGNCKYSAATSITKTFTVKSKDTPIFRPNGFSESGTCALKVGDKVTMEVEHVSAGLDGDFIATATQANGLNVLSFTREGNIITIEAINAGNTTANFSQAENSAIVGASKSYSFSVSKHQTSFSGSAFNLMVDGETYADYSYTNTSAEQPTANSSDEFYYTIDEVSFTNSAMNKGADLITFNPANKRISAHNAGTAKITLHQKETYKYTGATQSFNVAVYKYSSVFSGVADFGEKVGESKSSSYVLTYTKPNNAYAGADNHTAGAPTLNSGNFYFTIAQNVTAANTTGSTDASKAIEYNANTKTAVGQNAGTGTIRLYQVETYKYNAAEASFVVTVTKNDPVFTWNNNSSVYYHNTEINNIFSSTNTDCAYTIGASTDAYVAKEANNKLTVLSKNGTAQFTVSQPENYKWNAKSQTYTVTPQNPSNHVTFTYTQAMYNDGSITTQKVSSSWNSSNQVQLGETTSGFNWDDKYIVIHFLGIPDKISFQHKASSGAASGPDWYVQESANGSSWTDVWTNESNSTSWSSVSKALKTTTRYIKLCYSGNFAGYFKDIKVTELKKFTPNPTTLDFGTLDINTTGSATEKTFNFNYANVGHNVTLTTNDAHFTVSPAVITNIGGEKTGTTPITVTFSTAEAHISNGAKITIEDELGNTATVNLAGVTQKLEPTVTWSPDESTFNVDEELSATNANGLTVTLSVDASDASYVSCSGNTATMLDAKSGTVTITAHVTGDNIYADKDFTKEITITNLEKQYITWTQDLSRLKTTDASKSIELDATSSSGLPVTYELQGDKTGLTLTQNGNTWTLTYSASECKNTTIVAKQEGNEIYAAASNVSMPVKVIDPTKVCDVNETLVNSTVTLKLLDEATYNIDIPSTMTIQVSRTKTGLLDIYVLGFDVEIYSGRNGTGSKLHEYSYGASDINNSKTISLSNLNIAAKSVKLISNATNGYNVTSVTYTKRKDCKITSSTLSFETYPNTTTSAKTFDVEYVNYPISLECSNPKFSFSPSGFGDCSEYGTQTVSVTYTAGPNEGTDNGYLYIKDNTGVTLKTCTLSVSISKVDQSITSTNIQSSYKTTDKVTLSAEANSGLSDFTYSASPTGVASFDGSEMTFSQSGTIAITVSQAGSNTYRPTSTTINNVVVEKDVPNIVTMPTATSIQYLQHLNNSTLSGGSADITLRGVEHTNVPGTFAWTNPDYQVVEKAVTNNYSVTFTPDEGGMYTTNTCLVPVTVVRAEANIEMNDGEVIVRILGLNESLDETKIDLSTLIHSRTTDPFDASRVGAVTYEVISANKEYASFDGNHFSASVCGEYTIRATQVQTDYYEAATDEFKVTVNRVTPVISNESAKTLKVDDIQNNAFTIIGGKDLIPHITVKSISDVNNGDGQVIEYDAINNRIITHNAGVAEIYLEQPQTSTINAYNSPVYTYTVEKYSNSLTCSWNAWTKTANFDESVPVSFTTNNTDYANSPILFVQNEGDEIIATMTAVDATRFTMSALYNAGTSTWHLSQAENYKYVAAAHDVQLTVQASTTNCYVLEDNTEHQFTTDLDDFSGHFEIGDDAFDVNGPVNKISFQAKKDALGVNTSLTGEKYFVVQYSVDNGANWRTLGTPDISSSYQTFSYTFDDLQANEKVSKIRFGARTGSTMTKYYKDIKITRKTWLQPIDADKAIIDTLRMPDNTVGSFSTAKFYVDYSSCDDVIKLASDNEHFTLSTNAIAAEGDNQGKATEVTVTYRNNKEAADTATITLYTNSQHTTFTVVGKTYKKQQHIEWQEGFTERPLILPAGTVVDNNNIAAKTTRPDGTVVYTTDNPEVIEITMNGVGFNIVGDGEAKLSASSEGNDEWYPVSDTITIITSNKLTQEIVWEQSFRNAGLEINQDTVLEAKVYIRQPNGNLVFSQERTDLIVYTCPANNGVISLNQNIMTILNYGKTTVTASIAGTDSYIEAKPVTLTVKIGKVEDGCVTPNILQHSQNIELVVTALGGVDWSHQGQIPEQTSEILQWDPASGKPDLLSYSYSGENSTLQPCSGTVKAQQRINGDWYDIEGSLFDSNEPFDWRDADNLQLDENANAIRFVRVIGGKGKHSFKDIVVTLKHYLRPTEAIFDLEEVNIGERINKKVGIDYSDVKSELQVWKQSIDDPTLTFNDNDIDTIQCGAYGHFDLPISILPSKLGDWSDTILVADTITKDTISVIIKATVTSGSQYVFIEEGPWVYEEKWKDDKKPGPDNSVLITADVFIPDTANITISSMTIQEGVTVTVNGTLNLGAVNTLTLNEYGNLHVADGGKVNVGAGALLVNDFILDASLGNKEKRGSSGQVANLENFYVLGNAYFDLSLDPSGECSQGWYDFTVPFPVHATTGITRFDNSTHQEKEIACEVNYAIMDFSESRHLETGYGWKKYHSEMKPGMCYTITIDDVDNVYRFKKTKDGELNANTTADLEYTDSESKIRGWNGLGNGTLTYVNLDVDGIEEVQVYDHETNSFSPVPINEFTYVVGSAYLIQTPNAGKEMSYDRADGNLHTLRAPQRGRTSTQFALTLTAENDNFASDRFYVSASDEATDSYEIGRELSKFGNPLDAKVAQVWTNAYDLNLCDIELPIANNGAHCDLNIFAPKTGQYTFAVDRAQEDAVLFLTYNGKPIWNLSMSPYVFDLNKGTTEGYGLQIYIQHAPKVASGVDEVENTGIRGTKVIIDQTLYIITPEGAIYSATGKKIQQGGQL